jgi:hypothetical protein
MERDEVRAYLNTPSYNSLLQAIDTFFRNRNFTASVYYNFISYKKAGLFHFTVTSTNAAMRLGMVLVGPIVDHKKAISLGIAKTFYEDFVLSAPKKEQHGLVQDLELEELAERT